jgi:uncharacterized protein YlzI (FlbEa/FlbD family)
VWELLTIMMLNGEEAHVNPRHIVSIIEQKIADDPGKHWNDKVRCVVTMVDGKQLTTKEECDDIEARLHALAVKRIEEMRK